MGRWSMVDGGGIGREGGPERVPGTRRGFTHLRFPLFTPLSFRGPNLVVLVVVHSKRRDAGGGAQVLTHHEQQNGERRSGAVPGAS